MSSDFKKKFFALFSSITVIVVFKVADVFAQGSISSVKSNFENRIIQLERIFNAHSQLLTQLQQEFLDNQSDISSLRGQVQENQYQLNQISERQEKILLKINALNSFNNHIDKESQMTLNKKNVTSTPKTNTASGINSTNIQNKDDYNDYNMAIMLIQDKSHYAEAINAFQDFIRKYPNSIYQSNANYWLGQLNYNQGKKENAAYYFASVVKNYPKSPKAPDAMYKIGLIMQDKGDIAKAKIIYQQTVRKYPSTESAREANKRLGEIK